MKTRLSNEDIDAAIASAAYVILDGTTTTVCYLNLKNGFVVIGESACADPATFDKEVGEKLAYARAREKVWPLEGYLLRQRMYEAEQAEAAKPKLEKFERLYDHTWGGYRWMVKTTAGVVETFDSDDIEAMCARFPEMRAHL